MKESAEAAGRAICRVNELWQSDFTYFKNEGWGGCYLSAVEDVYSSTPVLAGRIVA